MYGAWPAKTCGSHASYAATVRMECSSLLGRTTMWVRDRPAFEQIVYSLAMHGQSHVNGCAAFTCYSCAMCDVLLLIVNSASLTRRRGKSTTALRRRWP